MQLYVYGFVTLQIGGKEKRLMLFSYYDSSNFSRFVLEYRHFSPSLCILAEKTLIFCNMFFFPLCILLM